jgi:hypothetical protein
MFFPRQSEVKVDSFGLPPPIDLDSYFLRLQLARQPMLFGLGLHGPIIRHIEQFVIL